MNQEINSHIRIGSDLNLFHVQEEAAGSVFWHKKGLTLFRTLENYLRDKMEGNGYLEVKTPQLVDKSLWEKSGHWEKFQDNMFVIEDKQRAFVLKPMNCPCHIQIFNKYVTSYKELPLRMSEFGSCHRNESSGSLYGTMRLRGFTQDDGHILCSEDQITEEVILFCKMLFEVYKDFGFTDVKIKFSDRPSKRAGSDETWDKAESSLIEAVTKAGHSYEPNSGEGAFYGPKLEFVLKDSLGRDWQCGTLQLDLVLPERLDAYYIDKDGSKKIPIMIHRAILGSLERFIGILLEHYNGNLPVFLAPEQVVVCSVQENHKEYCKELVKKLKELNIRVILDVEENIVSNKIKKHSSQKIPFIIIVGDKEIESNNLTIRKFGSSITEKTDLENFIKTLSI